MSIIATVSYVIVICSLIPVFGEHTFWIRSVDFKIIFIVAGRNLWLKPLLSRRTHQNVKVLYLTFAAKNTVISRAFLMWKFCGKAQFPHSFGLIARNYVETTPFRKISTSGNHVKLRYFLQWLHTPSSFKWNQSLKKWLPCHIG